jgi:predicted transposase YdaD
MKHRKSDILWKTIIEEVFAELLRFIYADADQVYDMDRGFEFLEKELAELNPQPDEEKDSRFADKLVKLYHKDGQEEVVLLHIEVQGDTTNREGFAERMYIYHYRIRDRYPGRLVSALAIFTGLDGDRMPGQFDYSYRGTELTYKYPTLSVLQFSDEELVASPNPFAQVVIAARIRLKEGVISEDELLNIKLLAANRLQEKGFSEDLIRAIFTFLRNYVLFEEPETNRKFDDRFKAIDKLNIMNTVELLKMEGREEGIQIGLTKGKKEGRVEGKTEAAEIFVENLLKQSDFALEKIAAVVGVTVDFVKQVKSRLNGSR